MTERLPATEQVLKVIAMYEERPYGPTRREIQAVTGLPMGTIQRAVQKLFEDDRIHYVERIARSLRVKNDK